MAEPGAAVVYLHDLRHATTGCDACQYLANVADCPDYRLAAAAVTDLTDVIRRGGVR